MRLVDRGCSRVGVGRGLGLLKEGNVLVFLQDLLGAEQNIVFLTCVVQILSGIITIDYGLVRWFFARCFTFVGMMAQWTSFAFRLFALVLVLIVFTIVAYSTTVTVFAQTTAATCRWSYLSSRGFSDVALYALGQIFIL